MDLISQLAFTIITGLIISIVTAVITVRLALRQFYSQRWWEQKWNQYSKILDSLYHIRHLQDRLLAQEEVGRKLSVERRENLQSKSNEASDEIDKVISVGAFAISEKSLDSLKRLRLNLNQIDSSTMPFEEYLDIYISHLDTCISEIREFARKDLKRD
jgi:hypothetical protein